MVVVEGGMSYTMWKGRGIVREGGMSEEICPGENVRIPTAVAYASAARPTRRRDLTVSSRRRRSIASSSISRASIIWFVADEFIYVIPYRRVLSRAE